MKNKHYIPNWIKRRLDRVPYANIGHWIVIIVFLLISVYTPEFSETYKQISIVFAIFFALVLILSKFLIRKYPYRTKWFQSRFFLWFFSLALLLLLIHVLDRFYGVSIIFGAIVIYGSHLLIIIVLSLYGDRWYKPKKKTKKTMSPPLRALVVVGAFFAGFSRSILKRLPFETAMSILGLIAVIMTLAITFGQDLWGYNPFRHWEKEEAEEPLNDLLEENKS